MAPKPFFGYSESFGFQIIASETLSETRNRNLDRNPKLKPKHRNCQNINNLFVYSLAKPFCAKSESFGLRIVTSESYPKLETSPETRNLIRTETSPGHQT